MVEFKVKHVIPKGGLVTIQINVPSLDLTFYVNMNSVRFNSMSEEELDMHLEDVVRQRVASLQAPVNQDRIARLKEKYK